MVFLLFDVFDEILVGLPHKNFALQPSKDFEFKPHIIWYDNLEK